MYRKFDRAYRRGGLLRMRRVLMECVAKHMISEKSGTVLRFQK